MSLLLFCYDGSDGSAAALESTRGLLAAETEVVVLTLWQPVAVRLAMSGGFAAGFVPDEAAVDAAEAGRAQAVAELGATRARAHGHPATTRVERGDEGIARTILRVADELDAALIVCGRRGRGTLRTAMLGSVSHELAGHAHRPVLIAPEVPAPARTAS